MLFWNKLRLVYELSDLFYPRKKVFAVVPKGHIYSKAAFLFTFLRLLCLLRTENATIDFSFFLPSRLKVNYF